MFQVLGSFFQNGFDQGKNMDRPNFDKKIPFANNTGSNDIKINY